LARLKNEVLAFDITKRAQTLPECLLSCLKRTRRGRGADVRHEPPDPVHFCRLLCLGYGRRKSEAESENDREPDQPHGHLGGDGWRESSRTPRRAPAPRPRAPGPCTKTKGPRPSRCSGTKRARHQVTNAPAGTPPGAGPACATR